MNTLPIVFLSSLAVGAPQDPTAEQLAREAAFEKLMSGCRMIGHFTDSTSKRPLLEDSYTIKKVSKLRDDKWKFDATIEYRKKPITVPIVVDVVWAGDTPMIQLTDLAIPMLGKFSARVTIYDGQYAGMWSGADHGGHMFGRIEKLQTKTAAQDKPADWRSWRGTDGSGAAPHANPPTEWSEDKNIRWKVGLPGVGCSTPIVLGDRIYLTTAFETDEAGEPPKLPPMPSRRGAAGARRGGERDRGNRGGDRRNRGERGGRRGGRRGRGGMGNNPTPKVFWEFNVVALNRQDGSVAWSKTVKRAVPHEGGHRTDSQASSSPLTDGEHLYAHFGSRGVHCLDLDGNVKWSKDLGYMRTRNTFGEGSSPAIHGNTLVVNWDHEGDSFVVAFDKRTGEEKWRQPRDEPTSWSTPVIATVDGKPQVIISATKASRAYDLKTGKVVWECGGMTLNAIPSPIYRDGIAYLMSGFRGASLQAIKLAGAKGDITKSEQLLWNHNQGTSYVPSALLYDDHIYFLRSNNAVLSCLDVKTGEPVFEGQRLSGLKSVYASPVGAGGNVYVTSREGATKVFKHGAEYEEIATNELDDRFDASPVVIGDEIYMRGWNSLYCIAEGDK